MKKKLLSLLLALTVCVSLLPLGVLASEEPAESEEPAGEAAEPAEPAPAGEPIEEPVEPEMSAEEEPAETEAPAPEPEEIMETEASAETEQTAAEEAAGAAASGTCGGNLTWTLDANGTLTISGTGAMEDYHHYGHAYSPWFDQSTSIKSFVIEKGVTRIGIGAVTYCENLTSVTISNSVTSIGDGAFCSCTSLTDINIPDSVISIGAYAFNDCESLISVTIPGSVTSIDEEAFSACTSLTAINVASGNAEYISVDGILYDKNKTKLIQYPIGKTNTAFAVPDGVTSIGSDAFNGCSSLTSVTIGNSVTSIGDYAFCLCERLTSVTIPDSVTSIGSAAFSGCTNLTDVYYAGSEADWAAISIGISNECLTNATIHYNSTGPEDKIAVFSTEKSLTVKTGESMWLGFGKFVDDGQIADDWKKMAVVVSDPTVISLSEYVETEYGFSLEVTGRKQGATNVTITDTESGVNTVIVITVRDSYIGTYSYAIDNMESFFPNNEWEESIQTNIYDLNGLYVNNYRCRKSGDNYLVSFDVYNSRYHAGAVDIYDANGNWIDCEEIKKYSMISSLWDTGEQAFYLLSDAATGKLLTYEQASFSEHTPISIEVPDGGYFTISNNFAESPGAYLFNACDILYDGTCTLIDAAIDVKNDKVCLSAFSDLVKQEVTNDKTVREKFIEIFEKTVKKEVQSYVKSLAVNEIDERYAGISGQFENLLNSLNMSVNWKHFYKSATGVGESAFSKFAGPAGSALKGCFAFSKGSNQLVQAFHLAASVNAPRAAVFSSIDEGSIHSNGIIVNTNGNIDAEAELHVFRVSNNNTIEVVLDGEGDAHLKKYEIYNICFVKNDQLVQPNGRVKIYIPIPDGMQGDTCNVYRQESDGTWTILDAHIEGNYLVFETDHFSLYGIVGEAGNLSISSLPNKTQYSVGDILDSDGLVLSLDGEPITTGFVCEPTVLYQAGTQKITVRYGVASAEFTVSVSGSSGAVLKGDVNGDGAVNAKDVTVLFQYVNKQRDALPSPEAANVNGDNDINAKDVTRLFQFANKQIDSL